MIYPTLPLRPDGPGIRVGDLIAFEEFLRLFYIRMVSFRYPGQQLCPVVPGATLIPPPEVPDVDALTQHGTRLYP